jgi:hypothetical protein
MANNFFGAIALTGGGTGALDAIDGNNIADGDAAFVVDATSDIIYIYTCNGSSGAAESSPDIISPDSNAGTKRWILVELKINSNTDAPADFIDAIAEIAAALKTGADGKLVTGTAGDANDFPIWNADGDIVGSGLNVAETGVLATAAEWTKQQNFNENAITSTSNAVAIDMDDDQCAVHTLTENTTLGAPSNLNAGATMQLSHNATQVSTSCWGLHLGMECSI